VGIGSSAAGLELMAMPGTLVVTAVLAGRWADRFQAGVLTGLGMGLVILGLACFALGWSGVLGRVIGFALIGGGLGAFTPANNSAVMSNIPRDQAALGSGILNMTRGLGTALGLSLSALVFDAAGGASSSPSAVSHAFERVSWFLLAVAVAAAVIVQLGVLRTRAQREGTAQLKVTQRKVTQLKVTQQ
jgi:hypothetical protein